MRSALMVEVVAWRDRLSELDPSVWSGADCAVLVGLLAVLGKACAAARARLAVRAASCGAHRQRGFAEAGDWFAVEAGISTAQAKRELDTAAAIAERCGGATGEALAAGELSL
ncbi:MAG: hypothetical protein QOG64_1740, partial [Acidimicrobiaceae bacterium]|nr:hypothetical protein [Acidimicrobiaceae bacterium]